MNLPQVRQIGKHPDSGFFASPGQQGFRAGRNFTPTQPLDAEVGPGDRLTLLYGAGGAVLDRPMAMLWNSGATTSSRSNPPGGRMRVYRPDLVAQLSREELLALRTEPEISREMVLNLAREGESYLRALGNEITAGRHYLAHSLGMGALKSCSAPRPRPIWKAASASASSMPPISCAVVMRAMSWAERLPRDDRQSDGHAFGAFGAKTIERGAANCVLPAGVALQKRHGSPRSVRIGFFGFHALLRLAP